MYYVKSKWFYLDFRDISRIWFQLTTWWKLETVKWLSDDMFSLANVRVLIDSFDCIHRPSLWLILRQYGIPDSIVAIIQSLYKSSKSYPDWCIFINMLMWTGVKYSVMIHGTVLCLLSYFVYMHFDFIFCGITAVACIFYLCISFSRSGYRSY